MKKEKTAKDLAFERVKNGYKKQLSDMTDKYVELDAKVTSLNDRICELTTKNMELEDWVDRLLKYMDMTQEDLELLITYSKYLRSRRNQTKDYLNAIFGSLSYADYYSDVKPTFPGTKPTFPDIKPRFPDPGLSFFISSDLGGRVANESFQHYLNTLYKMYNQHLGGGLVYMPDYNGKRR